MRVARYVVIVAALAAMGLGVVHLRARATRMGYAIVAEQKREEALLEERARLRADAGRLRTPGRLFEEAERLGLQAPAGPAAAERSGQRPASQRR